MDKLPPELYEIILQQLDINSLFNLYMSTHNHKLLNEIERQFVLNAQNTKINYKNYIENFLTLFAAIYSNPKIMSPEINNIIKTYLKHLKKYNKILQTCTITQLEKIFTNVLPFNSKYKKLNETYYQILLYLYRYTFEKYPGGVENKCLRRILIDIIRDSYSNKRLLNSTFQILKIYGITNVFRY